MLIVAATVFSLIIMPTSGAPGGGRPVPFDTGKKFTTDAECQADAKANMYTYMMQRGFSPGATANFACTMH